MRNFHKNKMKTFALVVLLVDMVCVGCVNIHGEQTCHDIVMLRGLILDNIHCQLEGFPNNYAFCCKVIEGWPIYSHSETQCELVNSIEFPKLGVVNIHGVVVRDVHATYDVLLGDEIISALSRSTIDDAVSLGIISNRMIRTAGLAWFREGKPYFSGIAIVLPHDVYFIPTTMTEVKNVEESSIYDIFWAEPPYYMWRNPLWSLVASKQAGLQECMDRISSKNQTAHAASLSLKDLFLENLITAIKIDVSPEEFKINTE